MTLYVHGLGHFHPENEISNRFLEELESRDHERLDRGARRHPRAAHGAAARLHRTTRNRDVRAAPEAALYSNAQMGARAAELALARAGIERSRIGMVISGSSAPGVVCPAEAAFVA